MSGPRREAPLDDSPSGRENAAASGASARRRSALVDGLIHDLRNPLNVQLTWLHLLRGGQLDAETNARALDSLRRQAELQARLLASFVAYTSLVDDPAPWELAPVWPRALVESAVAAVERQALDRSVRIELATDGDGAPIEADAEWLATAIRALLERAIEATPAGESVAVELRSAPDAESIVVRHGGAGFDADGQARLLDPVGPSDRERGHGNLRLELAIADCVARRHRGALVATSEGPESGARYELRLPPAASG